MNPDARIEELLEKPCWVIDGLPERVPENSAGQYASLEEVFHTPELFEKFTDILLKLNCYYDLFFLRDGEEKAFCAGPEKTAELVMRNSGQLCVIAKPGDALITYAHDDAYMTVYHADETMVKLVQDLASANGLFVWKPEAEVL